MSLSQKVAQNTFIQIFGKIISTILGLLSLAIMTRYLGTFGFGEYTTIITFISFFAIIADLGLTLVTVQMISAPGANEEKLLNNLMSLRLLSALIFLGIGPIIALFFPYSHAIKIGILITAISFLFVALNQIMTGLFQKKLTMSKSVWADIISRIFLLIGVALAAYLDMGLITILWVTAITSAISFFIQLFFSKKFISIKLEYNKKIWKEIMLRSWPLAVTIAFNLIYLKADTLILSLIKSPEEVGIYGSVYKIIDVLVTIPFMFAGVILPILTADWIQKNKEHFQKVFQRSLDFMIISSVPLIVGTQFLAKDIMVLIAGPEFAAAGDILKILIIAAMLVFISCIFSHLIIAIDKQKKVIKAYIFTSITALLGYLIFIPKFSYFGAAWTTIYSELCILLFVAYYAKRYTGIKIKTKIIFKTIISSLLMGIFIYLIKPNFYTNELGLIITVLGAMIIYFSSLYFFKGINNKDLKLLSFKNSTGNVSVLENK